MSGIVPIASSLSEIYADDAVESQKTRWNSLLGQFEKTFSCPANFVSRSPGRVNIIGEHIDYSLYGVIPMAIAADALLAVAPVPSTSTSDGEVVFEVANLQPERFPQRKFAIRESDGWQVDIDASVLEWTNYFKSGLRGALAMLKEESEAKGTAFRPVGMKILMDGNVPVGGGLSSSAAFVSASALAVLYANGTKAVDKLKLTELAIVSERAVGVNSGGMDQAASVLSEAGSALYVDFEPKLSARPVKMPKTDEEYVVMIAQSFVKADKHDTGPIHYNLRVVECSLAAAWLDAASSHGPTDGLGQDHSPLGISLKRFQLKHFAAGTKKQTPIEQLQELLEVTRRYLPKDGYTREEIAAELKMTVPQLEEKFMSRFPVRAEKFKLRQRAEHVYSEAIRVLRFLEILEAAPHGRCDLEMGDLMNATQDSCRDVYECSCPELDKICDISLANGSMGSRLTGAGWGGCTVHIIPSSKVEGVREALEREYYSKADLTDEQKEAAIVVTKPGSGSALFVVGEGALE